MQNITINTTTITDAFIKREVSKDMKEETTPSNKVMIYDPLVMTSPYEVKPRLAAANKQPKKTGFPFQIYLPYSAMAKCFESQLNLAFFQKHGVEIERNCPPLWLKTKEEFARVTLKRNSNLDANMVHRFLKQRSARVYKNWI